MVGGMPGTVPPQDALVHRGPRRGPRFPARAYRRLMARDLTRFHGALLHRSEWLSRGLHPRDLASGRFTTVFPGYLTLTAHPASFHGMAWVLQNSVRPGCVLSHTTAALLWGIPLPWRLEGGVGMLRQPEFVGDAEAPLIPSVRPGLTLGGEVSLPLLHCRVHPGASSGVGRGVLVHRHRGGATARRGRLVVSSQAETLRELATLLPLWDVVAAVEAVIGPDAVHPGETLESLRAEVEARRGAAGTPCIRRALELAREGVRSPGESVMRLMLRAMRLPGAGTEPPGGGPPHGKGPVHRSGLDSHQVRARVRRGRPPYDEGEVARGRDPSGRARLAGLDPGAVERRRPAPTPADAPATAAIGGGARPPGPGRAARAPHGAAARCGPALTPPGRPANLSGRASAPEVRRRGH